MERAKPQSISLFELNQQVKLGIKDIFPKAVWIVAEVSELNINPNGHCYLELIEKNADNEQITARAKATIWAFTFRMVKPYFESVTGQRLTAGIKIMVQVAVEFHELYGFSLNVKDIEPSFTLGDLSRKRQEIIQKLQDEGVYHLNKEIDLPIVPQRIAVISSETAAGYGDFVDQLRSNRQGYTFDIQLFQASMQGNDAEQSIIDALDRIFEFSHQYDVVAIIRGGGAQADLNCFNSYWLCYHITQFPLPILTGIGHDRDESIADLVAHTNLKTPTAVAEFLIAQVAEFDAYLDELTSRTIDAATASIDDRNDYIAQLSRNVLSAVKLRMAGEKQHLQTLATLSKQSVKAYMSASRQRLNIYQKRLKSNSQLCLVRKRQNISQLQKNLVSSFKAVLKREKIRLEQAETKAQLLDPANVIRRGYSITFSNGKLVKSISQLSKNDQIETILLDGSVIATIDNIDVKNYHD